MSLVLCALTLFSERCHFNAIKLIYKHLLSRFRFPYGRENRKFGEVWVLTTATSLFETCTYHPPACRSFSPLARALIPSAIKLADFVTEAIFEQRGSSNMCLIWKYATYNLEWAAPVGQNRSRDQGTRLNGDCLHFALQSKLITCARKMARTKKYTIQTAQKSKQKRKKQLAEARKCRKINQKALDADRTIDSSESSPGASTSTSTTCAPVSNADILGERTRSQFKSDCYSSIEASRVDINSTEPTGNDVCASGRGVVDFSKIGAIVSKLCCPQCHNTSLAFRCNSKQQKGLAVFADVYCATCEETVEGTATYLAEKGGQKDYEVNRQAVFGALSCGLGAHSFNNLCESMDLPGLHHKTFHKKANQMYKKLPELGDTVFSETVQYVRKIHAQQQNLTLTDDLVINISVSFDGSWMTRGHTSHIGVGCVVDLLTGLCIDAHVMCTFCQVCESTGKRLNKENNPEKYAAWIVKHLPDCDQNYTGKQIWILVYFYYFLVCIELYDVCVCLFVKCVSENVRRWVTDWLFGRMCVMH